MRSLRLVRVSRVLRLLRAIRVIRELRMMVFSIMSSLNVTRCGNLGARDIQCLACNLYLWPYHRIIYVLYVYCIMMIRRVSCAMLHPWIGAFGKRRGKRANIERYKAMSCSMSGLWKWFFQCYRLPITTSHTCHGAGERVTWKLKMTPWKLQRNYLDIPIHHLFGKLHHFSSLGVSFIYCI